MGEEVESDDSDPEGERCEVCGKGAWNEPGLNAKGEWIEGNWMLLCDGCDTARHTLCCWPPLLAVREGGKERGGETRGTAGTWR